MADQAHMQQAAVRVLRRDPNRPRVHQRAGRSSSLVMGSLGFTLIETMVVVAIIAILAGLAAPSFRNLINSNRAAGAASALQVSLNLARSEAIRRGGDTQVTIAANGTAGAWANGWTVFVDGTTTANGSVAPTADSTASGSTAAITRIEVVKAPSMVTFGQTGALNYFMYNGQGRMVDVNGNTVMSRSAWFSAGDSDRYCLVINNTGRVRFAKVGPTAACPSGS